MPTLKPSQIVVMAAGAVMFLFSFMKYIDDGDSRWSEFGLFTLPAIIGLLAAAAVAVRAFADVQLPDNILTLTVDQLLMFLALTAVLIDLGTLIAVGNFDQDLAIGFWLTFLGSIGLLAGTVMEQLGTGAGTTGAGPSAPPSSPPTSF